MTSGLMEGLGRLLLGRRASAPRSVAEARITSGISRATRPRPPPSETTEAAATAAARKAIERRRERLASTRDCRSHRSGVFDRLTRHLPTRMD
jgi:hypothetical protein